MITAVIVDDMPQAVEVLQNDLEKNFEDIDVVGTANSVINAAKLIRRQQPDLLFLDIMLGDGTGFDLLEIFPQLTSKVIFVTAHEEHAIKAFRFAAVDYLLKPIGMEHLKVAVDRCRQQIGQTSESLEVLKEAINDPSKLPERITLHTQERIIVVEIKNIVRCESDSNNTLFILSNGDKIFVTKTLKHFESLFSEHAFLRSHQSHLINCSHIHEYVRKEGGYLKMKNGDSIPVAVRKKAEVIGLLDRL